MFDEAYCSGMTLGLPEVSLVALHNLGRLLESLKRTRMRAARFSSRKLKEKRGAAKKNFGLGATSVRSESQPNVPPVTKDTPGLIDAVVALLVAAIGVPQVERPIESGGADEQ